MKRLILTSCMFVLFASCTALADWNVGDPYKMHFPQLPDPDGWDVEFNTDWVPQLADDWMCTESGEVNDVHIWYSWEGDSVGEITKVQIGIWSNDPDGGGPGISTPDEMVWPTQTPSPEPEEYLNLYEGQFTTLHWSGVKQQGWYDPYDDTYEEDDHYNIYQLNVVDIPDPFSQQEGEIYWLSVCLYLDEDPARPGWKTSEDHFMDDAVFWKDGSWHELKSPVAPYESLDLAFVITPEPATISLLGLGSLVLLRKRRRV